jgi:hypothetical protein
MGANPPFQVLPPCPGAGVTRGPEWYESQWAELLTLEYFRRDFMRRYAPPALVIGQLEYLSLLTGNRVIDQLLTRMARDFVNELSRVALRKDLGTERAGGRLKPDILGIAIRPTGDVILEVVEVTTEKQAATTLEEDVKHKLQVLREKVLSTDVTALETDYFSRSGGSTRFIASASKWRPNWDQMIYPLVGREIGASARRIEWLCFAPTFRFAPPSGLDGLILYELHSVGVPQFVPEEVLRKLAAEIRRQKQIRQASQAMQTLTPWITEDYWRRNAADKQA